MKCEECTTAGLLEEFLDGELAESRATDVRAHLAACHACALRYDALLDEQTMYASYERDVKVTPGMWSAVATRIAADEKPPEGSSLPQRVRAWLATALVVPRFSPALTAALMLIAIGATATVMRFTNSQLTTSRDIAVVTQPVATSTPLNAVRPTPEATPNAALPVPPNKEPIVTAANDQTGERAKAQAAEAQRRREAQRTRAVPSNDPAQILAASQNGELLRRQRATERLVREAESKYVAAIKMLSEDVNRKRTRLDPQVVARFDETLAAIDRSIAETRRTVLQQRNDPVAVQYMLSAYAKKVEVMREMAAVD